MADELMYKRKGTWAFILAAAAAPIGYILTGPCGSGACGGCPASGACLLMFPVIIIGVVAVKSARAVKGFFGGLVSR